MKLILTNDDGYGEPGLECLIRLCQDLGEVIVVAPAEAQSGVGHTVTEARPLHLREIRPNHYTLDGKPADCVRVALTEIAPDADWVLSGINAGANLGIDTYVSGTVAAAREAASFGRPAAALSQFIARFQRIDWARCQHRARSTVEYVLANTPPAGGFWNANFPHPHDEAVDCERVECEVDPSPASIRYERKGDHFVWSGDFHERPRRAGHDIDVCFGGRIALTRLRI